VPERIGDIGEGSGEKYGKGKEGRQFVSVSIIQCLLRTCANYKFNARCQRRRDFRPSWQFGS